MIIIRIVRDEVNWEALNVGRQLEGLVKIQVVQSVFWDAWNTFFRNQALR